MSQEWLESSPVTIKQDKDKIIYEVEYKERDYKTTPGDVLVNIYKYIRDIADTHSSGKLSRYVQCHLLYVYSTCCKCSFAHGHVQYPTNLQLTSCSCFLPD